MVDALLAAGADQEAKHKVGGVGVVRSAEDRECFS